MLLFLASIFLLATSCRKKDDSDSGPVNPVDPTQVPPVFNNAQPRLMSEFEISRNKPINGHLLVNSLGKINWGELIPGAFGFGIGIFDIVSWTKSYAEHQKELKEMNQINSEINLLHVQDSLISAGITELVEQLNYSTAQIMNQINNAAAMQYISDIKMRFGNQDHNGLRYYSLAGANYENNKPGYDSVFMSGVLQQELTGFINTNVLTPVIDNDFNGLNLLICPVIPMDTSCLFTFAKLLVSQSAMSVKDTSEFADFTMYNYLLLESYFFSLLNYQYEAATIKINVLKQADTLQMQAYVQNTMIPAFKEEADMFLQAASYLLVNIADYRSLSRWKKDAAFSGLSMAPNTDMYNAMARAQFRVAELYQTLDLTDQPVFGSIIVPRNFCSSPPLVQIGTSGSLGPNSAVQSFRGIIPYTLWSGSGTALYDNNWDVYHYNLPAGSGTGMRLVQVNPTWPHISQGPGYGYITPLWYNPANPDETSSTQTDSCIIQFASFCLSWQWGTLMTDYITTATGVVNRALFGNFEIDPFGAYDCHWCGNPKSSDSMKAPFIAQWHSDQLKWENIQNDAQRSFRNVLGGQSPFHYTLTDVMQPYSSGSVYLYDQVTMPVSVPRVPPNGGISMFASYTVSLALDPWPSTLKEVNLKIGSTLIDSKDSCGCSDRPAWISNGNVVNVGSLAGSGSGLGFPQPAGTYYPGFQYWFNVYKSSVNTNVTVQFYMDAQMVFTGYAVQ
jgi:hypothetical protein